MEKKFTRVFVGYKAKEVEKTIMSLNEEFEITYNEYNKELSMAVDENQRLKEELESIKQQLGLFIASRSKLEGILYDAHMGSTARLYNAEKELETMIENKSSILRIQQNKNDEIKESINSLLNQIQMIVQN